jgi:hydroxymethylpyrimidine pyrophosphatase-like HAD family hydrolase
MMIVSIGRVTVCHQLWGRTSTVITHIGFGRKAFTRQSLAKGLAFGVDSQCLAVDYDGTLASNGVVAAESVAALERLRAAGVRVFLVTGREVEELKQIFPQWQVIDTVVAENGGVLCHPSNGEMKMLHAGPPPSLVDALRARGVTPLSVGHVLVATRVPKDKVVLEIIKQLGLEVQIIFNKGAVMVLPAGVNKATGLAAALKETGLSPDACVGVGDAENDHAFLDFCGCAVAVANALDSLKQHADYVTQLPNGAGVAETVELLLAGKLPAKRRGEGGA